jgi:hypothetical protein
MEVGALGFQKKELIAPANIPSGHVLSVAGIRLKGLARP